MTTALRRCTIALIGLVALAVATPLALAWRTTIEAAPPPLRESFDRARIERGASLAAIGNCAGCHTAIDGAPYSGGRPLPTPFGTVYASNVTPDPETGIGAWSPEAFTRAMREGIARDGTHLYPAFPYDHFTRSTDEDLAALYAFLMTRTPVTALPRRNQMRFPFGLRPLVAVWNTLFLDRRPFVPDPNQDATWNRGAYLSDALAHCSACHSPRNALGAERRAQALAGGDAEGWYAPPLNADSPSPQPWSVDALTRYLRTGMADGHAVAGGPMQSVTDGLAHASESDVHAIAVYMVSQMGAESAARKSLAMASAQRAARPLADDSAPARTEPQFALGASVYASACASCHDLGRTGSSAGALRLPLAVALYDADPRSFLHIVREGITPSDGKRGRWMPAFGSSLSDEQLTALAAYLRSAAAAEPAWPDLAQAVREPRGSVASKGLPR